MNKSHYKAVLFMLFQFLYIYYSNTLRNVGEPLKDIKLLDSCCNDGGMGIKFILRGFVVHISSAINE